MHPRSLTEQLGDWIAEGRNRIGEILILRRAGGWRLTHREDAHQKELAVATDPHAALAIARLDPSGQWRPLRAAPTLRRGWALDLADLAVVRLALEFFYPGALGNYAAWREQRLQPTPMRETLDRQTGMYRITQLLTDAQAGELVPEACASASRCMKTILWDLRPGEPIRELPSDKRDPGATGPDTIPLLCSEACNLLVAAARETVKRSRA